MKLLIELWKLIADYSEKNGYSDTVVPIAVVVAVVICLGLAIGWLFGQRRVLANIGKLHSESSQINTEASLKYHELLAAVENRRTELTEQKKQLDKLLQEIRDVVMSKRVRILRDARDEICQFHANSFMPVFTRYLELCHSLLPRKECHLRMIGEIIPSLETQLRLLETVNMDAFFERIKEGAHYHINARSAKIIFARARMGISVWRIPTRWHLRCLWKKWKRYLRY
jgi:hypothetical protein